MSSMENGDDDEHHRWRDANIESAVSRIGEDGGFNAAKS